MGGRPCAPSARAYDRPMTSPSPHILVTGSTRGIGAAIVDALGAKGAEVIGHGRADAESVIGADLALPGAADALWDQALTRLGGRIDVLVNNAGVFEAVAVDAPADEWQAAWSRTLQINLQACADLSRRAILHWRERGHGGRIVADARRSLGQQMTFVIYRTKLAPLMSITAPVIEGGASRAR